MENQKRRPIRGRILTIVLLISAVSLIVTSMFGIASMLNIQKKAEDALTEQAKTNLENVIEKKTEIADQKLEVYIAMVRTFIYYVEDLIAHPDRAKNLDLTSADTYDTGDLVYSFALADESYDWNTLKSEAEVFANISHRFYPLIMSNGGMINTVFFGFDNGLLLSYDDMAESVPPELMYYNFLDTDWYKLGKENNDVCFTDAYSDSFGRGLTITCVGPVHDKDGKVIGVLGMDIHVTDLYNEIIDLRLGEKASVFILGSKGNIISLDPDKVGQETADASKRFTDSDKERIGSYSDGIVVRGGYYFAFNTIKSVGWKLFVRVPQSQVLEFANTIGQSIISSIIMFVVFFLIILVTVVIIIYEFSEKITKPLTDLTKDVKEISGGDLDYRASIQSNDEIGDLALSFNEMAESLKNHIENLTSINAEKERIIAELDIAAKIQLDTLPVDFPEREDIEIYAFMKPAKEVGGDFYDFFFIDDDHLALVMADVSGKGVPAALFMVISKSVIRNNTISIPGTTGEIMSRVNNILIKNNRSGFFVTAWLGILTISTGELRYTNAGHEYPAIKRAGSDRFELYRSDNYPPLATQENLVYGEEKMMIGKYDKVFLYTDGVPDAKSPEGKHMGIDRMLEKLDGLPGEDTKSDLIAMRKSIAEYVGYEQPFDDVTALGFKLK